MRLSQAFCTSVVQLLPAFIVVSARFGDGSNFPSAVPIALPSRPLQWGDINIFATTDSHGFLLGHQKKSAPEPNYSGNFGEFASFISHMKEIALKRDVDFLLVDSGDLHDGTGLVDGFLPGGIDAHDANEFFARLPYDILTIGNHELYVYQNTLDMHKNFAPKFPGRYLSSNVNITLLDIQGKNISVPVGSRFAKFYTRKWDLRSLSSIHTISKPMIVFPSHRGRRVTAFGVLFDFTGNAPNTTVQKVKDMVVEQWFLDAIVDEPDFFLLVGHMPVANDNWPLVFNAIRAIHPYTPIMIFGGHTHIRDCLQLDGRSMALESGRYMETIGFLSAKLDEKGSTKNIAFSRRYLDTNRITYEYHSGKTGDDFDTRHGRSIIQGLLDVAKRFDLSFLFGMAPRDYLYSRVPYPSEDSLLSLYIDKAIPAVLAINNTRASNPRIVIVNTGGLRSDLYKGPFTKDDKITIMPFKNTFMYIPDVPDGTARRVLPAMNAAGPAGRREVKSQLGEDGNGEGDDFKMDWYTRGYVEVRYQEWLSEMDSRNGLALRDQGNLTLGYVTQDSCPGVGDDTLHAPLPFYEPPAFVGSESALTVNMAQGEEVAVDLVFYDFIQKQVLQTLNAIQEKRIYNPEDVKKYHSTLASEVLGLYAQKMWK